ncbi:hypothetical protein ACHQM5_004809 [Ranunculus cassubicifolius]
MVKAKTSTYEEVRKRRIEENMKKMQDLKLSVLSLSLHSPIKKQTKKVACRERNVVVVEKRRSNRIAMLDPPCYNEGAGGEAIGPRSKSKRAYTLNYDVSDEAIADAQIRAHELLRNLGDGNPSFVKKMKPSHISGGFWLGLDVDFCRTNLPKKDVVDITLIDKNGCKWSTKYLAYKHGLSGGWRAFSIDRKLDFGDALVFELIDPHTFKVYIVRINS